MYDNLRAKSVSDLCDISKFHAKIDLFRLDQF